VTSDAASASSTLTITARQTRSPGQYIRLASIASSPPSVISPRASVTHRQAPVKRRLVPSMWAVFPNRTAAHDRVGHKARAGPNGPTIHLRHVEDDQCRWCVAPRSLDPSWGPCAHPGARRSKSGRPPASKQTQFAIRHYRYKYPSIGEALGIACCNSDPAASEPRLAGRRSRSWARIPSHFTSSAQPSSPGPRTSW
jgi:hypothetical protein